MFSGVSWDENYGNDFGFETATNDGLRIHYVYEELTRQIYENTKDALNLHPEWSTLTYNGGGAAAKLKRTAACRGFKLCESGVQSRDEFPYATTEDGGIGAWVNCVDIKEQNIQRTQLRILMTPMIKGDKFNVVLVPKFDTRTRPIEVPAYEPYPDAPFWLILIRFLQRVPIPVIP